MVLDRKGIVASDETLLLTKHRQYIQRSVKHAESLCLSVKTTSLTQSPDTYKETVLACCWMSTRSLQPPQHFLRWSVWCPASLGAVTAAAEI